MTMPQPGAAIYRQLQVALDQVRTLAISQRREVTLRDGQLNELIARKGTALLDLAKFYLPEISRPAIESTFAEIRGTLLEVLGRKERTQAELTARAQRFVENCQKLEEQLAEVTGQLNEFVRRRDAARVEVSRSTQSRRRISAAVICARPKWKRSCNRTNARERTASFRRRKAPAVHDRSSLFQYLFRRGYGTSEYQARGTIRSLDKWVADMIDFPKARHGYEFLKTTPKLMAEEVARRKAEFKTLMEKIEAIEDRYSDAVGLTAIACRGSEAGCETRLKSSRRSKQRIANSKRWPRNCGRCKSHRERSTKRPSRRSEQFLLSDTDRGLAKSGTEIALDPRDEEIVSIISELNQQIDSLKRQIAHAILARKQADEVAGGMDLVVNRFRQNNFDSERSSFAQALDIASELQRYQQGLTKPEELWQLIRRQQQFEPTWPETASIQGAQIAAQVLSHPAVSQALASATFQVVGGVLRLTRPKRN